MEDQSLINWDSPLNQQILHYDNCNRKKIVVPPYGSTSFTSVGKLYRSDISLNIEYNFIKKLDIIDPLEQWHIGHPLLTVFSDECNKFMSQLVFRRCGHNMYNRGIRKITELIPIFRGLLMMDKYELIHGDIKTANIIYDDPDYKLIDFEYSFHITDIDNIKRNYMTYIEHILRTKSQYPYWPSDSILNAIIMLKIYPDIDDYLDNYTKSYIMNNIKDLQVIFDRPLSNMIQMLYDAHPDDLRLDQNQIKKFDVYSLGVTLKYALPSNSIINRLIQSMLEPLSVYRISPQLAHDIFMYQLLLINKTTVSKYININTINAFNKIKQFIKKYIYDKQALKNDSQILIRKTFIQYRARLLIHKYNIKPLIAHMAANYFIFHCDKHNDIIQNIKKNLIYADQSSLIYHKGKFALKIFLIICCNKWFLKKFPEFNTILQNKLKELGKDYKYIWPYHNVAPNKKFYNILSYILY